MANVIPREPGIYRIRNSVNGKVYVGSAVNLAKRWRDHVRDLDRGTHRNSILRRAWHKYGASAFEFVIVALVPDRESLIVREQAEMDASRAIEDAYGYNIAPRAGSRLGCVMSQSARDATAAGLRGRKLTEERKAMNGAWYRSLSEAERLAMRERQCASLRASAARRTPAEKVRTGALISEALRGKSPTPEHRTKIATSLCGRYLPAEHKERIAAGLARRYGRPVIDASLKAEMAARRAAGASYGEIGRAFGLGRSCVRQHLIKLWAAL